MPRCAPPLTVSIEPVMYRLSSLSRKATVSAMSSGSATRPIGVAAS